MNEHNPPPLAVLLEAAPYDRAQGRWLDPVRAAGFDAAAYKECDLYCPHCLAEHRQTPLRFVNGRQAGSPAGTFADATGAAYLNRFDLKDISQPHGCEHPVRFKELDKMAQRYGANPIGDDDDHAYEFTLNIPGMKGYDSRSPLGGSFGTVARQFGPTGPGPYYIHTAERLSKVTHALMFDAELRERQRLKINGISHPFDEVVYAPERMADIVVSLSQRGDTLPENIALVFKPNPRGDFWMPHARWHGIPTSPGRGIEVQGRKVKTGLTVFFGDQYGDAKEIIRGHNDLFVIGAPRLYAPYPADPAVGEDMMMAAMTVLKPDQISDWKEKRHFHYPVPQRKQLDLFMHREL